MAEGQKTSAISDGGLRLTALTIDQMAKILSASGAREITEQMIQQAIESGAAALPDGRINLIEFAAWLEKDLSINK